MTRRTPTRALLAALAGLAALTLLAAGCSDGDGDTATDATSDAEAAPDDTTAPVDDEPYVSGVYAESDTWICRPDLTENPCLENQDVTVVQEDGTTESQPFAPAEDPAYDCFYVYPTINLGDDGNAPFDGDYGVEQFITTQQAGPFAARCDVYAPVYRQITMGAFGAENMEELADTAYQDVADSFRHYLANDNDGRPFVLMGHSQGSGMITRLIQEEIDDDPELRDQMISALVIGSAVGAPEGEDVGGDFENVPACREPGQTGCVVTYATFRSTAPPPPDSLFGRPRSGEGVALCTNPAALAGGSAELDPRFLSSEPVFAPDATTTPVETPWWVAPGLLTGECVQSDDGFVYLAVTVNSDPDGPRVDDIGGDDLGPNWGLHAVDYNVAFEDLLAVVAAQAEAWLADG